MLHLDPELARLARPQVISLFDPLDTSPTRTWGSYRTRSYEKIPSDPGAVQYPSSLLSGSKKTRGHPVLLFLICNGVYVIVV